MSGYAVQIGARQLSWPKMCACCGEPSEAELRVSASRTTGIRVRRTRVQTWRAPICVPCLSHTRLVRASGKAITWGVGVWLLAVFGALLMDEPSPVLAATIALLPILIIVLAPLLWLMGWGKRIKKCTSYLRPVRYRGWYGSTHEFVFRNREVLDQLLAANPHKMRSEIRRTLI